MSKEDQFKYAVGVDLGGTFVKVALVSNNGDLLFKDKLPVRVEGTKDDVLETIKSGIQTIIAHADENRIDITGIGIGSPGIVYDGIVHGGADNLNGWKNVDLAAYFSKEFDLPVLADNDANVMGLGEVAYGAAKGSTDVIFITVGTGIGGAIFVNGKLYGGHKNRGAELGHITVEHNGIECNCGGRGCLEVYASTTALIKQYAVQTGKDIKSIDGRYIVERFKDSEEHAVKCIEDHTDYLGHGIAGFINIFSPQKVIIGGGISEAGKFYIDMIQKAAFNYAMPDCAKNTHIAGAKLGNDAGCLGAASLIFENLN
ncbi:MAG: ROK family protein [Bacteroidota bacterium]